MKAHTCFQLSLAWLGPQDPPVITHVRMNSRLPEVVARTKVLGRTLQLISLFWGLYPLTQRECHYPNSWTKHTWMGWAGGGSPQALVSTRVGDPKGESKSPKLITAFITMPHVPLLAPSLCSLQCLWPCLRTRVPSALPHNSASLHSSQGTSSLLVRTERPGAVGETSLGELSSTTAPPHQSCSQIRLV